MYNLARITAVVVPVKKPMTSLREELEKLAADLTIRENEIKVLQVELIKAKEQVRLLPLTHVYISMCMHVRRA